MRASKQAHPAERTRIICQVRPGSPPRVKGLGPRPSKRPLASIDASSEEGRHGRDRRRARPRSTTAMASARTTRASSSSRCAQRTSAASSLARARPVARRHEEFVDSSSGHPRARSPRPRAARRRALRSPSPRGARGRPPPRATPRLRRGRPGASIRRRLAAARVAPGARARAGRPRRRPPPRRGPVRLAVGPARGDSIAGWKDTRSCARSKTTGETRSTPLRARARGRPAATSPASLRAWSSSPPPTTTLRALARPCATQARPGSAFRSPVTFPRALRPCVSSWRQARCRATARCGSSISGRGSGRRRGASRARSRSPALRGQSRPPGWTRTPRRSSSEPPSCETAAAGRARSIFASALGSFPPAGRWPRPSRAGSMWCWSGSC